jgi:hypothetical protein
MLCARCAQMCKPHQKPIYGDGSRVENVSKAGNPLIKQSKYSVLTCEIMYAMF